MFTIYCGFIYFFASGDERMGLIMAEFGIASIFTDKCVLQRRKRIRIWGTGETGQHVCACIDDNRGEGTIENGKWELFLAPMEAADGKKLVVSCGEIKTEFNNVSIGEVWLAGGQSNMEYELQNCTGGREMMDKDNPNVRFYYTPKYEYEAPKFEHLVREAHWETFDEPGKARWSAVGYIFARELSEKLGVTVGVIGCNWGGTSASAWMSEQDIREDDILKVYYEEYDRNTAGKTFEEQEKIYDDYLKFRAWWEPECAKMYTENPNTSWDEVIEKLGDSQYPGPINACNPMRPAGLYNTMTGKVNKYTIAGVIYYQGESDDHRPDIYDKLLSKMINRWRCDNGENFPFIAVSLPMHRYKQDPDFKNWPVIRYNQRKVARETENVGLAVCTDLGEFNEIHPHDKRGVAHRLFLQAMWLVYNEISAEEANGPMADCIIAGNGKITVHFAYADDGLVVKGEEATGFEIAEDIDGVPGEFVPAKALVEGNRVVLSADSVKEPAYVRYLWTNYSDVTLFGKNGICAEPFKF